jgi:hypothetical protein
MQRALPALSLGMVLMAGAVAPLAAIPLPAGMTTVPLVAITNDRDTSISEIEVMLGPRKLIRGLYIETYENKNEPDESQGQVIPLSDIESAEGAVVGQGQGVKAILLRGKIEPLQGNGALVVKYLTNGISRRYDECEVGLRRVGPDQWRLVNAYNRGRVEHIHVKTWALGISRLENVCPTGGT